MGLKDLFSRKKSTDDDEDDDDFDDSDFDDDDDSGSSEAASGDDDEDPGFGGSSIDDGVADGADDAETLDEIPDGDADIPDADSEAGEEEVDDFDDLDVEGDDPEFDDDDDDDDDDGDDDGGLFSNPLVLYSTIGAGALLILIAVGVGGWMLLGSDDKEVAEKSSEIERTTIALPPAASSGTGGLNDLLGADDKPPVSEEPSAPAPTQPSGAEQLSAVPSAGGLNALAGGGLNAIGSGTSSTAGLVIQASTISAFEPFVDHPTPDPLSSSPDPDFIEKRNDGELFLPKVASDGRLPWEFYSRPSDAGSDTKRVAILVTGLGLSQAATLSAIKKLPPAVTLSFSPYAEDLDQWWVRSRRAGHEVVLGLPLESSRFPIEDPGPMALQTRVSEEENLIRLEAIMSSFQGYVGLEVIMGSKFTSSEPHVQTMLDVLHGRGLMILEGAWNNRSLVSNLAAAQGMPRAFIDMRLDSVSALSAIDAKLAELDTMVTIRNQAIATTSMSPAILGRLKTWFQTLPEKNMKLVPVSALVTTNLSSPNVEP